MFVKSYQKLRVLKYKFLSNAQNIIGSANCVQPILLTGQGLITFGKDVYLGTVQSPFFYSGYCFFDARNAKSTITIGDGVWSNNNLTIISQEAGVSIGDHTIIGSNVEIYDSDFHHSSPFRRKESGAPSYRVHIGQNVWIGSNVKILKGVTIGENSIIANGSIVTNNIPSNSVWGGVPATFLKNLEDDQIS